MRNLTCSLLIICALGLQAQINPYKGLGEKAEKLGSEILTLSNGKYNEFHDNDTIVQIGSVLYNTVTKTVVGIVEYETEYSEATLKPEVVSMWLSPDPLARKFPHLTPYNFVENNPINMIDPDGRAASPIFNKDGQLLGTDSEGYKGDILVMDDAKYQELSKNGTNTIDHTVAKQNSQTLNKSNVSASTMENIISDVMCGYALEDGTTLDHTNFEISSVPDDPNANAQYDGMKDGKHQVSERGFYYEYTVENIRSVIGDHEVYGHGILGLTSRETHFNVVEQQLKNAPAGITDMMKQNIYYNLYRMYPAAHGGKPAPRKYWDAYIKYGGE